MMFENPIHLTIKNYNQCHDEIPFFRIYLIHECIIIDTVPVKVKRTASFVVCSTWLLKQHTNPFSFPCLSFVFLYMRSYCSLFFVKLPKSTCYRKQQARDQLLLKDTPLLPTPSLKPCLRKILYYCSQITFYLLRTWCANKQKSLPYSFHYIY